MQQYQTTYINFTGGIVSPGNLKTILEIALDHRIMQVRFGLRQQVIIDVPVKRYDSFMTACEQHNITVATKKTARPNLVSSYPAAGIFSSDTWLSEGVYKDVFDLFDYEPEVKINICDSTQSLVPLFTGHINWVSSSSVHFWHVYVRDPRSATVYCLPDLIYTNDIALVSKAIERLFAIQSNESDGPALFNQLKASTHYISKGANELMLSTFSLPYYEGFNRYDNNYWLGIYRRNELFDVAFLLNVCALCIETKVGQLYTTPWKGLVIKGIETVHRPLWEMILGRFRINVRHAANELNWQVEDNSEDGLQIKRHIIRHFDKEDVRTFGLSFAVQTMPHSRVFGSVIIKKHEIKNPGRLKSIERFEILYTTDFNPNSVEYISYRTQLEKEHLGTYLVSLCKLFYEQQQSLIAAPSNANADPVVLKNSEVQMLHQCKHCYTIYDEIVGDVENGIALGTPFELLPDTYECPLCSSTKVEFTITSKSDLQLC